MSFVHGILLFCIVMVILIYAVHGLHSSRRKRLMRRDPRDIDSLLLEMGMQTEVELKLGRALLKQLGEDLGVDASRLRSTDRFDTELSLVPKWIDRSDIYLDSFEEKLVALLDRHDIQYTIPPSIRSWRLCNLMEDIVRYMREQARG